MTKRRLLVVDAPGGPRPEQYLRSLCEEFSVTVVWLSVEPPAGRDRRRAAVSLAPTAVAVENPLDLAGEIRRVADAHEPDGMLALSERVVHVTQLAAQERGLPANRPETLQALQDKRIQREQLAKAGLAVPEPWVLHTERDCAAAGGEAAFPAVLKPSVGMGSIATYLISSPEELLATWRSAMEIVAADSRIAHHSPVLLLEELLPGIDPVDEPRLGDYVSVEVLVTDDGPNILAVSDKLPLSPPFRENAHFLPSVRPPAVLAPITDCVLAAHEALGITHGVTHTEVKLTPAGPAIIEVNGRVGGGVTEELRLAANYDLPLQLARTAVRRPADTRPAFHQYASFLTPQPPHGHHVVRRSPTTAELRAAFPALDEIVHVTAAGQVTDSAVGTAGNLVKAFAAAPAHEELVDLAERITGPEYFRLERTSAGDKERNT